MFRIFKKGEKESQKKKKVTSPPKEGLDYYIENGYYVFTAYYLSNRGYCCTNGCRHCPYNEKEKD